MKAIQGASRGGYDALRLVDIPPPQPRDGQALVHVTSAGVTPLDRTVLAALHPRAAAPPLVPGNEGAGVVIEDSSGRSAPGSACCSSLAPAVSLRTALSPRWPPKVVFVQGRELNSDLDLEGARRRRRRDIDDVQDVLWSSELARTWTPRERRQQVQHRLTYFVYFSIMLTAEAHEPRSRVRIAFPPRDSAVRRLHFVSAGLPRRVALCRS